MNYLERAADAMLSDRLDAFGAVLLEGPKWCGKTTTASQQAKSIIKMQDTDNAAEYLATAATKPSLLLRGENPRLIDEWQDAPNLWDAVRDTVDNRPTLASTFSPAPPSWTRRRSNTAGTDASPR